MAPPLISSPSYLLNTVKTFNAFTLLILGFHWNYSNSLVVVNSCLFWFDWQTAWSLHILLLLWRSLAGICSGALLSCKLLCLGLILAWIPLLVGLMLKLMNLLYFWTEFLLWNCGYEESHLSDGWNVHVGRFDDVSGRRIEVSYQARCSPRKAVSVTSHSPFSRQLVSF